MQEVAQGIICYKIGNMALQEMRWQGSWRINKPDFTIIYSGTQKRTGHFEQGS
jgi:hypothetical protein